MFKKVDDEKKKKNYSMMGGDKSKAGTGGKDKPGGEPAKPSYDPKSEGFADVLAKYNNDGKMGYGYVDPNTGVKVPWYIDMINGGGANAAGPEFVSPFEGMSGGLGGLAAQGITGALNNANVAPYGYNRPRTYAQPGMQGYPGAAPAPANNGTGGGSSTPLPNVSSNNPGGMGDRSGPVYTPATSYRYMPMGEPGRMPGPATGVLPSNYSPVVPRGEVGPLLAGHNQPSPIKTGNEKMSYEEYKNFILSDPMMSGLKEEDFRSAYNYYLGT